MHPSGESIMLHHHRASTCSIRNPLLCNVLSLTLSDDVLTTTEKNPEVLSLSISSSYLWCCSFRADVTHSAEQRTLGCEVVVVWGT